MTIPKPKPSFKTGTKVRLVNRVRQGFQSAKIQYREDKFSPGAVYLDKPLNGFRWWNVEDLRRA